jgi:hypothetical protein
MNGPAVLISGGNGDHAFILINVEETSWPK